MPSHAQHGQTHSDLFKKIGFAPSSSPLGSGRITTRDGSGRVSDALAMEERLELRNALFDLRIEWRGDLPRFPGAEIAEGGATIPLWTAAIVPFMHKPPLRALRNKMGPLGTDRGKAPALRGEVPVAECVVQ